jgi:hypothetical protein
LYKKDTDTERRSQINVEFLHIEEYRDLILFDGIHMDAFHLLIRTWYFVKGLVYDGKNNTYTIMKDGKIIKLLKLKDKA